MFFRNAHHHPLLPFFTETFRGLSHGKAVPAAGAMGAPIRTEGLGAGIHDQEIPLRLRAVAVIVGATCVRVIGPILRGARSMDT